MNTNFEKIDYSQYQEQVYLFLANKLHLFILSLISHELQLFIVFGCFCFFLIQVAGWSEIQEMIVLLIK